MNVAESHSLMIKEFSEIPGVTLSTLKINWRLVEISGPDDTKYVSINMFVPPVPVSGVIPFHLGSTKNLRNDVVLRIEGRLLHYSLRCMNRESVVKELVTDIRTIVWETSDVVANKQDLALPDSRETARLLMKTAVSKSCADAWSQQQVIGYWNGQLIAETEEERGALLVYGVFRACKGRKSLDACRNFVINQLQLMHGICSVELIPTIVAMLFDKCRKRSETSITNMLFQSGMLPTTGAVWFFNNFKVESLCGPSTVAAENMVDRKLYAVRVVHMKEDELTVPPEIAELLRLVHRYVIRYYNTWIEKCSDEESVAVSNIFCLSPPVDTPATFMFIQMDYVRGRRLSECLTDSNFFMENGTKLRDAICCQILEALQYLHSQDIVYGALSSDNVFVNDGNVILGDFSNRDYRPWHYYEDERTLLAPDDMFAFGILYYEIWHPFRSKADRERMLDELRKTRNVPADWKRIFPVQAAVIIRLLQEGDKRPTAVMLMQGKLVKMQESSTDVPTVKALMTAISSGSALLDSNAAEVPAALFSESRCLRFRLADFESVQDDDLERQGRYDTSVYATFVNMATIYDAVYLNQRIINNYTADEDGVCMMTKDGHLYGLYSRITRQYIRWIKKNHIKSIRTFSKHTTFCEKIGPLSQRDVFSFDIVSQNGDMSDVFEGMTFIVDFLQSVLHNPEICFHVYRDPLRKLVSREKGSVWDETDVQMIKEYAAGLRVFVIDLDPRKQKQERIGANSMIITARKAKQVTMDRLAVLTRETTIKDGDTPTTIISARISVAGLHAVAASHYKFADRNEIMFIVTKTDFRQLGRQSTNQNPRGLGRPREEACLAIQEIAARLREHGMSVSVVPSNEMSMVDHIDNAKSIGVSLVVFAYVAIDRTEMATALSISVITLPVVLQFCPCVDASYNVSEMIATVKSLLVGKTISYSMYAG